ncbi:MULTISPECIES: helix-turn-helix domain-containing protein [unclassified Brevundimonas]|uniref:helix-turn-helix domain-containing protein n=1 Tax=unclassified Brevundimonas TaxID=2622653 RepID=UPI0025BD5E54|nr:MULTISPECIES: helix-turn-helix transcriptional regulator [unclassified Brevundimonas]
MPDTFDIEIGRRIRQARIAAGLTQQHVADAVGVSAQAFQKYEKAESRVSLSAFAKMRSVLSIDLADILPSTRSDGSPINSPTAAIGNSITGVRLANLFSQLTVDQQRALLDVAKAMVGHPQANL